MSGALLHIGVVAFLIVGVLHAHLEGCDFVHRQAQPSAATSQFALYSAVDDAAKIVQCYLRNSVYRTVYPYPILVKRSSLDWVSQYPRRPSPGCTRAASVPHGITTRRQVVGADTLQS